MKIKTDGAMESASNGTDVVRVEAAGARAKRSSVGGESTRAFAKLYRMGGRARVYISIGDDGHASFDLERKEAIEFATALLAKVGVTLES